MNSSRLYKVSKTKTCYSSPREDIIFQSSGNPVLMMKPAIETQIGTGLCTYVTQYNSIKIVDFEVCTSIIRVTHLN